MGNCFTSNKFTRLATDDNYDVKWLKYQDIRNRLVSLSCDYKVFIYNKSHHTQGYDASELEKYTRSCLNKLNLRFVREIRFNDCADVGLLRFDFYLPDLNILIEVDGQQHFRYTPKFHETSDDFERSKRRDTIKNCFCASKIHLLRLSYSEKERFLQHISEMVRDCLGSPMIKIQRFMGAEYNS